MLRGFENRLFDLSPCSVSWQLIGREKRIFEQLEIRFFCIFLFSFSLKVVLRSFLFILLRGR